MDKMQIETLRHHDKIATTKARSILMVSEPCKVFSVAKGGWLELVPGDCLRVKNNPQSGLVCDLPKGGRVHSVSLPPEWYHCVDVEENQTVST